MNNFSRSNEMLARALKKIPLGSQTFSKSHIQYPDKLSPLFIDRGEGVRIWDIDGNCFIDLVNGLMANVLGYNDPDVNAAIIRQLGKGITFSMATELEYELASMLTEIIPCAEMVRFGKNGSDATAAAIRLARAYTKRDMVLACGYHGWQDWYIGATTRNLGVPEAARLTKLVPYNNLELLEEELKTNKYAAFIMEPTTAYAPNPGYLEAVRELTARFNTVLIFDEMVTGFHFAMGGAQEYFNVTPDLACFGKGMGNGMPISCVVGNKEIMRLMDDIFFSGTFGGETLSLAAAIAVITKMKQQPVIQHLWSTGEKLSIQVQTIIESLDLADVVQQKGYAPWRILAFSDFQSTCSKAIKTFFQKEMIANGVLILSSHNICYSLGANELTEVVKAYKITLEKLKYYLTSGTLLDNLGCPVIEPIFKVRL